MLRLAHPNAWQKEYISKSLRMLNAEPNCQEMYVESDFKGSKRHLFSTSL